MEKEPEYSTHTPSFFTTAKTYLFTVRIWDEMKKTSPR